MPRQPVTRADKAWAVERFYRRAWRYYWQPPWYRAQGATARSRKAVVWTGRRATVWASRADAVIVASHFGGRVIRVVLA
jgi:hypothetical protein